MRTRPPASDEADRHARDLDDRFRVIFDYVHDGILVIAADTFEFIDANPRICAMFGYTHAEMLGLDSATLSADQRPLNMAKRDLYRDRAKAGEALVLEWRCRTKEGLLFWAEIAVRLASFEGRAVFLLTAHDISERRRAQDALTYYDRIVHSITLGVAELVAGPSLPIAMARALKTVGEALDVDRIMVFEGNGTTMSLADAVAFSWLRSDALPPVRTHVPDADQVRQVNEWLAPLATGATVISYAGSITKILTEVMQAMGTRSILMVPIEVAGAYWGRIRIENCRTPRVWTTREIEVVGIFARVTGSVMAGKRAAAEIVRMASHDALTGLPNRRFFIETLEREIARAERTGTLLAVLYLDLDQFKDVNDTLGHPTGDRLLQEVADRLRASMRATDTIARFGGDEFAAIGSDIGSTDDIAALARNIATALGAPFVIGDRTIQTGTSIGIAVYGPDSADAESLLSHADIALYRAKRAHRGTYSFYTEAMDAEVRARIAIEAELAEAIAGHQFVLMYQPQVEVESGRIAGFEALLRWQHPTRGLIGPKAFIAAAEQSGAILALGRFVQTEACAQMKRWIDAGIAPRLIGVNVSGVQFKATNELVDGITTILAESGVAPHLVELELTESVLMEASLEHNAALLQLRAIGLRIAIDDFGTGYSSLDYLRRFRVDRIKIPGSFVTDICSDAGVASIVRATIGLARELDVELVVEGVERAEQLALLKSWGCRVVQGFYFSRPLDVAGATALLHAGVVPPAPA